MQDAKEEVRSRLNIEDVVGEYVQLKRAGRNFKGLSPFSGERTPSFFVSPDKHIWHDFSSNKGGDVFAFVMEVEGMDFRQALEHLARKAGVDLSVYDDKGGQEIARKKKRLLEAHDWAAKYYQQSLVSNKHAIDYVFKKRGLSKKIVQEFRIGYAPDTGDALVQFLAKKGFTKKELADGGLTNRYGGDMFRGRMTVPLMDSTGQVIGFTARTIKDDDPKAPKYLNTQQTLLYDKSRHVFGLSQAKEAIRTKGYAVIVEGNMDVISSHQAGMTQVVATAGTALTEHQLRALTRLSGNVRLAYDNDKAGLAATERSIPIAQTVGAELTIVTLEGDAKDADELIQQDPKLWQQSIDKAEPVVDWILKQYEAREDISTAAGKRRFTTAALNIVRTLQDAVERDHYLQMISKLTDSSLGALVAKLESSDAPEEKRLKPAKAEQNVKPDDYAYQDNAIAVALCDAAVHDLFTGVKSDMFAGEDRQAVVQYIIDHQGKIIKDTPPELKKYDIYVKIVLLKADTRYADWSSDDRYFETARLLRQVTTEHKKHQKKMLDNQLHDAEAEGDEVRAAEIRTKLMTLIKEIHSGR